MKYVPWSKGRILELVRLWNKEIGSEFPIREALFTQNSIEDENVFQSGSWIATTDDDRIIGFIVSKKVPAGAKTQMNKEIGHIQVLLVDSDYRNSGIGSALLDKAENALRAVGCKTIFLGRDPGHYFPGIPVEFEATKRWFEKRGYEAQGIETDLVRVFRQDEIVSEVNIEDIQVSLITRDEKDELISFLNRCFPGRWEYEAAHYFESGGTGREFIVFRKRNQIIGFCRINDVESPVIGPNVYWSPLFSGELGGIGPLGIDQAERKNGYGLAIVQAGITILRERKIDSIVIDWTGLVDFYQKLNFNIWKQYQQYSKKM